MDVYLHVDLKRWQFLVTFGDQSERWLDIPGDLAALALGELTWMVDGVVLPPELFLQLGIELISDPMSC